MFTKPLLQSLDVTELMREKFSFIVPIQQLGHGEIQNLVLSVLDSIAFRKDIVEKLKRNKLIKEEYIKITKKYEDFLF